MQNDFRESISNSKRYTDERIKIIKRNGMIAPKDLTKVTGVSVAAISQKIDGVMFFGPKPVRMWLQSSS